MRLESLTALTAMQTILYRSESLLERRRRLGSSSGPEITHPEDFKALHWGDPVVEARLQAWQQAVAKGDADKFVRRLAWDGVTTEQLRRWLSHPEPWGIPPEQWPPWAILLQQVLQTAPTLDPQAYADLDPEQPLPFEPFFQPFLQVARQALSQRIPNPPLGATARLTLEWSLVEHLSELATPTLLGAFRDWRSGGDPMRAFLRLHLKKPEGSPSQEQYWAFLRSWCGENLTQQLQEYSVLGRVLATATWHWVEATAEFLQHVQTDWPLLEQTYAQPGSLHSITGVKPGLSDPHQQGRRVIGLSFDNGLRLVYKPKSLALEVAFARLLSWIGERAGGALLPLKAPVTLDRQTHGWVEFMAALPCADGEAAGRYFRRSGMLLALVHLLEGTDCHFENLIAHGEHPVLVDGEALLHQRPRPQGSSQPLPPLNALQKAARILADSVLRTVILPHWGSAPNQQWDVDLGGLGGSEPQVMPVSTWKHLNTDAMEIVVDAVSMTLSDSPSHLAGEPTVVDPAPESVQSPRSLLSANDYLEDLIKGYREMGQFLIDHREALLAADGPIETMRHSESRYIFRSTRIYAVIQEQSLHPKFMKWGLDRSLALESLSRAYVLGTEKPRHWPLLAAELAAMEILDIPCFLADCQRDDLVLDPMDAGDPPTTIPDFFEGSSFERARQNLLVFDASALEQQAEIIRQTLYGRYWLEPQYSPGGGSDGISPQVPLPIASASTPEANPFPERLRQEAIRLGQRLCSQAIVGEEGSLGWLGIVPRPSLQEFLLRELPLGLSDGLVGIALFFAALARTTGDPFWKETALATLKLPRQALQEIQAHPSHGLDRLGLSGASGIPSIIYGLACCGEGLAEPLLLEEALAALQVIHSAGERGAGIPQMAQIDVMRGSAGTLLALLGLYKRVQTQDQELILQLAQTCGAHIQESYAAGQKGGATQVLTGFAQGAAGIAYSLVGLFRVTQQAIWLELAEAFCQEERQYFVSEQGNWLDLRSARTSAEASGAPRFGLSWAQGAPGIGLARLAGLPEYDTPLCRQEIEIALATTRAAGLWGIDSLYWGNLGRLELWISAAQILGDPDRLVEAQAAALQRVQQATESGFYTLFAGRAQQIDNPPLFHGLAGIGYQLLRLADPDQIPAVLLWG
ncbi:MAG: type 2 lanthipeptide synthetase LanM family protein [Cyanobacteriota bacterium]